MLVNTRLLFYTVPIIVMICIHNGRADFEQPVQLDTDPKILSRDVKCLVCKATIDEMEKTIGKIDPSKKINIGGRFDLEGNTVSKTIQYSKSETYLTELMETICEKMDDYAKARYKTSRKLTILKMVTDDGGMNPDMSAVDFVQDGDLNKSLKHYCLEILEDHEESVLKLFMKEQTPKNIDIRLCTEAANYCDDDSSDELPEIDVEHYEL